MGEVQWAVIVGEHAQLGYMLTPYVMTRSDTCLTPLEPITADMLTADAPWSEVERELITTLCRASEKSLCERFSRGKNVKQFLQRLNQSTIDERIGPYLDRLYTRALDLAHECDVPIYLRSAGYRNLHADDRLVCVDAKPTFYFYLRDGALSYTLKIADAGGEKSLYGKKIIELTGEPASLVVGGRLYRFRNLQSSKFRPFAQKQYINVPPSVVPKYMQTFVRQCIMNNYVRAFGFGITRRQEVCRPMLIAEETALGYSLRLYMAYGDCRYEYGTRHRSAELEEVDGRYTFYTCQRDLPRERRIAEMLSEEGLQHTERNEFVPPSADAQNAADIVAWLNEHSVALTQMGVAVESNLEKRYHCGAIDLSIDTHVDIDWFELHAVVTAGRVQFPFVKLLRNLKEHRREYLMSDGQIFVIPDEWFTTWAEIAQFATAKDDCLVASRMHASLLPECAAPKDFQSSPALTDTTDERRGDLKAVLRPYQAEGFKWMKRLSENNRGGILADDMGLGKTLQTIALLLHTYTVDEVKAGSTEVYNRTGIAPSVVVVPVSLIENWRSELQRFAPQLSTYTYMSPNRPRSAQLPNVLRHYHVVLTSYGVMRNDEKYLAACHFRYMIMDESQAIKNPTSRTYHAVRSIDAEIRLSLSGTPIENSLGDLWAQMNVVNPGLLGSGTFFRSHFLAPIMAGNVERKETLMQIIAPFILRRTKEMVARDLPPIATQTVMCSMSEQQREMYEREKSGFRNELLGVESSQLMSGRTKFMALQALTRLRMIANHPAMISEAYDGTSGKMETALEYIGNIVGEGHKVLVFSAFVRDLALLRRALDESSIDTSWLTGSTTDRQAVIDEFCRSERKKVFLISLKAGGVGLNLTCADYVLMLNPWWNPAAEMQAVSRAHRIGQTKNVMVYKLLTEGTIEEKIAQLQERKRQLAQDIIITADEVIALARE